MIFLGYILLSDSNTDIDTFYQLQKDSINNYVNEFNHEIKDWYTDNIIPKGGDNNRFNFYKLIGDITNDVDGIVVYSLTRLARSLPELSELVNKFKNMDKCIVCLNPELNTFFEIDKKMTDMIDIIIQFNREIYLENKVNKNNRSKTIGRKPQIINRNDVINYVKKGLSITEIAKLIKVTKVVNGKTIETYPSSSTIRRRMKEWGILHHYLQGKIEEI